MNLREETKQLHDELEGLSFNVKMFKGEQTDEERMAYLLSNRYIFRVLDEHMPIGFRRLSKIDKDINTFRKSGMKTEILYLENSIGYAYYLDHHCKNINAHLYLNYMGFMYGGQIMKKRYPNSASLYEFDDIEEKRLYIREKICEDNKEFVDEVKFGYRWHINISKEMDELFNGDVG